MIYQSERVLLRDRTVTRRQNFWGVSKSQQQSYTLSTTMAFFTRDCWRQGQVRVTSLMMIYFIHNSMLLLLSDNLLNVSDRTAGGPMLESAPQIQETLVAPTNLLATKLLIGSWYKWACHKKNLLIFLLHIDWELFFEALLMRRNWRGRWIFHASQQCSFEISILKALQIELFIDETHKWIQGF